MLEIRWRTFFHRPARLLATTFLLGILLTLYYREPLLRTHSISRAASRAGLELISATAYVNTGATEIQDCHAIRHEGHIAVQQSFHVEDDIQTIAATLENHPMIDYSGQDSKLSHQAVVNKTWARMAQSSVWLEQFQVYLTVTRTFFYDKDVRHWPVISFLRGQLHDSQWRELKDYTIEWQGTIHTFPKVFDVSTPYEKGGAFYGPEDPRVIIEPGVPGAEPVIIFNMMDNVTTHDRSMFVFKPFTGTTTMLSIRGKKEGAEKNWMPFFYRSPDEDAGSRPPAAYLHFVYWFLPLKILKCKLSGGLCDWVYTEEERDSPAHNVTGAIMTGGTNFYPLPDQGKQASFIGFPRTHVDRSCKDGFYRPKLVMLTASADNEFHIGLSSESLEFSDAAMNFSSVEDPCAVGRILILNSIARWEMASPLDAMTVTFTVDDFTTQVLRLGGIKSYLESVPGSLLDRPSSVVSSQDVIGCTIEAAIDYGAQEFGKSAGYRMRHGIKIED